MTVFGPPNLRYKSNAALPTASLPRMIEDKSMQHD